MSLVGGGVPFHSFTPSFLPPFSLSLLLSLIKPDEVHLIPMQKFPHFQILCSKENLYTIWHTKDKTRKEMLNLGACVCVQNFHQFFWANNLLGKELQLPTSRASHYGHMTLLITKEPGIEDGGCVQPAAAHIHPPIKGLKDFAHKCSSYLLPYLHFWVWDLLHMCEE